MRDIASEEEGCISLEAKSTVAAVEDDDTDSLILEDICEVVISLKCIHCQFLCNDKATLTTHIKQAHAKKLKTVSKCTGKQNAANNVEGERISDKDPSGKSCRPDKAQKKEKPDKYTESASKKLKSFDEKDKSNVEVVDEPLTSLVPEKTDTGDSSQVTEELDEGVEDVFLCAECDIVFSSREMCCSHMHEVHGLEQFSADFIQEEIISKPTQEAQNSKRKRKTNFPKQFSSEAGTIVPKKYRVTKDVFHTCSKCPIKFESVEVMKFHEQCHNSTTRMDRMDKNEGVNEEHNNGHGHVISTEMKGFICPVCESNSSDRGTQSFPKWGPCSWHLWKEHRIDCELYTCSVCKQFKSHLIARVKDHEQLHSTKASYKCKTCNKTFKQMKQLRCHEKYHKDNSTKLAPQADSRWYTPKECPICKRILSDSKCLKKHISAVHNKLKPYVCNICGHTSARKAELQLHVRQHTGEKPYKCPICSFQTGDHNSLRKHKLRHSDERPYSCSYCDYRCIQSSAFKKHILAVHPGQDVVFLCHLCSHASVNERLFAAHQKDHAEGRIPAEDQNESERKPDNKNSSTCNSNGPVKNGSPSAIKYWSGDEDSLDIIDNGGVTIPASPQTATETNYQPDINIANKPPQDACVEKAVKNGPKRSQKLPQDTAIVTIKPCQDTKTNTTTSTVDISTHSHSSTPKETFFSTASNGKVAANSQTRQFLVPQGFIVPPSTSSLQSLPSPRPEKSTHTIVSTSSTSTSEDTESSTSEVITNPHQLIQNIQLTPLDLTDIISCNEQSNDDGMLQRLLDMSGV